MREDGDGPVDRRHSLHSDCELLQPAIETAHQEDDEADEKDEAEGAATDDRAAEVKAATAEEEQKDKNDQE